MPEKYLEAITILWSQLVELYGNKAEIKYGEVGGTVFDSWCNKLQGLQSEDIIRGLNACIVREQEWPPELQEFIRLCIDTKPAVFHKEYKKLPILKADKDSCRAARNNALSAAGVIQA